MKFVDCKTALLPPGSLCCRRSKAVILVLFLLCVRLTVGRLMLSLALLFVLVLLAL